MTFIFLSYSLNFYSKGGKIFWVRNKEIRNKEFLNDQNLEAGVLTLCGVQKLLVSTTFLLLLK